MQGGAIPGTEVDETDETVIDLSRPVEPDAAITPPPAPASASAAVEDVWSPSLYGPRPDAGPAEPVAWSADTSSAVPVTAAPADVDALAAMAAEVAVSVARHREELAAAMAELTALQRVLRSEVRGVIAELDRIAAGVVVDVPSTTDSDPAAVAPAPRGRGLLPARLRRAH